MFVISASAQAEVRLHKVGDFSQPVYVTGAPGDDERLYVVERAGTVQVVENGVARPFLDLRDAVRGPGDAGAGTEEGLLSIAFAPDFETSRRLYVYFTEASGDANHVEELVSPTDGTVDPASRRLVIAIPHAEGSHHNGGQIAFGPDGLLYIAPGDGGTGGAPARDLGSLLGKLLRIDPRGAAPGAYGIPAGNPFAGQAGGRDEIWAYGLRNPFRFSFDRVSGDLTIGDVGEKTAEEINHLPFAKGRGHGADLGWNACEGSYAKGTTARPCGLTGSVLPAIEWTRESGFKAIVNGYVVRDPSLPSLYGRYVYGDFYVDALRTAVLGPGGATDDREIGPEARVPRIASFGEDAGGCLYAASYTGAVYRLVENDTQVPCRPAPVAPPADADPPVLRTRTTGPQRAVRLNGVVVYVRCDEGCRVAAEGRLRVGRRSYPLRATTRPLAADVRGRVVLRMGAATRRALRRALAAGRRPYARIRVRALDTASNRSSVTIRTIRVRR